MRFQVIMKEIFAYIYRVKYAQQKYDDKKIESSIIQTWKSVLHTFSLNNCEYA